MDVGRSAEYRIMRVCERFGMIPPDAKANWNDCDHWVQSILLGYEEIREREEEDELEALIKAGGARV